MAHIRNYGNMSFGFAVVMRVWLVLWFACQRKNLQKMFLLLRTITMRNNCAQILMIEAP